MKRDMENINLRDAFKLEPEGCHTALMNAARSAQAQPNRKRAPLRAAWIIAVILVAMIAAAFAAGGFGLVDWFGSHGIELPQAAQDILSAAEPKTIVVGPIYFTVRDILADGRVSYLAVEVRTADGSPALLYMGNGDPSDSIGYDLAAELDTEGIIARTSYIDAAKLAGLPLYSVDAFLNPKNGVTANEEMMDSVHRADGSILLIDMLYTDPEELGDTLQADVILRAVEIDTDTLERKGVFWSAADARTIPIGGVTAEKTYAVSSSENLGGYFTVTKVTAEQTCAGVYVTVHATVSGTLRLRTIWAGKCFYLLDAQGNPFPPGISMIEECLDGNGSRFNGDPETIVTSLQYRLMITVETLPDSLIVSNGSAQILVEAVPTDD